MGILTKKTKEEIIAKGSLSAKPSSTDSKAIPINVGEWLRINIEVNYKIYGYTGEPSSISIINTVEGQNVTLKTDSDTSGSGVDKKGTYTTTNGIIWASAEVNNLLDIYKHIGNTDTDWGGLQDNKTNIITISVKKEYPYLGGNSKAIADYTITGIRRVD